MSKITPAQSRAARGYLEWSQPTLADMAGISLEQVRNFEKRHNRILREGTKAKIEMALSKAGIVLIFGGIMPEAGARRMPADVFRAEVPLQ